MEPRTFFYWNVIDCATVPGIMLKFFFSGKSSRNKWKRCFPRHILQQTFCGPRLKIVKDSKIDIISKSQDEYSNVAFLLAASALTLSFFYFLARAVKYMLIMTYRYFVVVLKRYQTEL